MDRRVKAPALMLSGVSKRYGQLLACADVDFDVVAGEVHALLGENGAGKTTLMRIASGALRPDTGTLALSESELPISSTRDAIRAGIDMVHQHFSLVPTLSVFENIVLGGERPGLSPVPAARMRSEIEALMNRVGMEVPLDARAGELSVELKQRVEILKVLNRRAQFVILDEPTALLDPLAITELLDFVRRMRDDNRGVVLITHKLDEVLNVADRITVMREGRVVGQWQAAGTSAEVLAMAMVGSSVDTGTLRRTESGMSSPVRPPILDIRDLTVLSGNGSQAVDGITLEVGAGEILGVAGVSGNGQSELVEALSGLRPVKSGQIELAGTNITHASCGERTRKGLAVIPEDRHSDGLLASFSIAENLASVRIAVGEMSRALVLNRRSLIRSATTLIAEYQIQPTDPSAPVETLSGGNQQKLLTARALQGDPRVVLAAHPTRGLDVAATRLIHERLRVAAERGTAIVLVTHDLDELLVLASRVVVMSRGSIVYDKPVTRVRRQDLGVALGGTDRRSHAAPQGEQPYEEAVI